MSAVETKQVKEPSAVWMTQAGEGTAIDVLGVKLTRKLSAADNGHQFAVIEALVPPEVRVPMHNHPEFETFYMLSGEVNFFRMADGKPEMLKATPGTTVSIPSFAYHGFENAGKSAATMLIVCPEGIEKFFDAAGTPMAEVTPGPPSAEAIQRVVRVAESFGHTFLQP